MSDFKIKWFDHHREPQCPPDPARPNGTDVDFRTNKNARSCTTDLPYPAKRCGLYIVVCKHCGTNAVITTAGRPDDPRKVTLPCKLN